MEQPQLRMSGSGPARKAADSSLVVKRMQTELMQLMKNPVAGVSAFPAGDGSDMTKWRATVAGPDDTPYAGLTLKLEIDIPSDYPYKAPTFAFRTPIYHPNVDFSGRICLDILKSKWSAAYNIQTVLLSLQSLLGEPNNDSPLNAEAAELWVKDMAEFTAKVRARHRDIDEE